MSKEMETEEDEGKKLRWSHIFLFASSYFEFSLFPYWPVGVSWIFQVCAAQWGCHRPSGVVTGPVRLLEWQLIKVQLLRHTGLISSAQ